MSRWVTRADRRLANRLARRDLQRLASGTWRPGRLSFGYRAVLVVASTLVYAVALTLLLGSIALAIKFVFEQAWLGVVVFGILAVATLLSLFTGRPNLRGVEATRQRFPTLWRALDEVAQRVGTRAPQRVIVLPDTRAFVFQHRPARRLFQRERVLALGAGYFPLLSQTELMALLAHELAHYRHGHTALHLYVGRAQLALEHLLEVFRETVASQTGSKRPVRSRGGSGSAIALAATLLLWIPTLPLRVLYRLFHLVRLAESRAAEFDADLTAVKAYGTQAFIGMLTALGVTTKTFWRASSSLRAEMARHQSQSYYAELRRHYAALPPAVIEQLRAEEIREYRTLERSHPITPDRLRAALQANIPPPLDASAEPAVQLLVPAGADSADGVEAELTALLFSWKTSRR
ncbi:MAG TPA: M48 family metalloprotease [Ktedonobacterales bacterium]|nr:M48 family metalloprotease [Ktedonobacterales bacterium]